MVYEAKRPVIVLPITGLNFLGYATNTNNKYQTQGVLTTYYKFIVTFDL